MKSVAKHSQHRYLHFVEALMYTMRESELIEQYLPECGKLSAGNEDLLEVNVSTKN